MAKKMKKIWVDMDNSPHVPFFNPIIRELKKDNEVLITARDCFQVCGLADLYKMDYRRIGHHYGKNKLNKVLGLLIRAVQLTPLIIHEKPALAVSHGSRSQLMLAAMMEMPSVLIMDYEHTIKIAGPTWLIMPDILSENDLHFRQNGILKYPGIKEDVYVPEFQPDPEILKTLGLSEQDIKITIRPPATEAHYHNPEGEILFKKIVDYLGAFPANRLIILPRNEAQAMEIRKSWPGWCESKKIIIPEQVVNGLNLIWHSDLVISGGGTINREAAALGVPVYSIFRGMIGAIDDYLSRTGRLVLLQSEKEFRNVNLSRRAPAAFTHEARPALDRIVEHIRKILKRIRA